MTQRPNLIRAYAATHPGRLFAAQHNAGWPQKPSVRADGFFYGYQDLFPLLGKQALVLPAATRQSTQAQEQRAHHRASRSPLSRADVPCGYCTAKPSTCCNCGHRGDWALQSTVWVVSRCSTCTCSSAVKGST